MEINDVVLYCIVLYCIVLYCIVLYCIVLYCIVLYCIVSERRGSVVVNPSAWHAAGWWFDSRTRRLPDQACFIIRCKNLALNIIDCLSLCLSEETLKAVVHFYLVSMPGEVKYPTQGVNRQIPCRGLHTSLNHSKDGLFGEYITKN